jgi:hypothetical protein
MACSIILYDTGHQLVILFAPAVPEHWYTVTAVSDGGTNDKLYGSELFLYEEPAIELAAVALQFYGCLSIEIDDSLLYVHLREREPEFTRGFGFGREARVGVDAEGLIRAICIPWHEPGAATPTVDRHKALAGLEYQVGKPLDIP